MIYQKVLLMHGERVETDTVEGVSQEGGFEALRGWQSTSRTNVEG